MAAPERSMPACLYLEDWCVCLYYLDTDRCVCCIVGGALPAGKIPYICGCGVGYVQYDLVRYRYWQSVTGVVKRSVMQQAYGFGIERGNGLVCLYGITLCSRSAAFGDVLDTADSW